MIIIKRYYQTLLEEYLSFFPVVAIVGARQCGKTTLTQELAGNWTYFDLEKAADYDQIHRDPDLFLRLNTNQIIIDEAQLLPSLFPALRVAIDQNRNQKGRFIITGSSSPELLDSVSESLAGRIGIIELSPLLASEAFEIPESSSSFSQLFSSDSPREFIQSLKSNISIEQAHDYWFQGGYPEPWVQQNERFNELWFSQYFQTYVNRDLKRHFPKIDSQRFRLFLQLLAGLSGDIINYSNVARHLGISVPTARDYFHIAHHTFIWRTLWPYEKNVQKQITKHPKGFLRDTGILHQQLRLKDVNDLLNHPQMGHSWEGMVIEHILRSLDTTGTPYQAYHYRTKAGSEIDLILEGSFGTIPIEIKYTSQIKPMDLRGLKTFCEDHKLPLGIIINNHDKITWHTDNIVAIPFTYMM